VAQIADVDCTQDHSKTLCKKYNVESYPTLKYFFKGFSKDGDAYEGPREYKELKKFVKSHARPHCDFATLKNCNKQEKTFIKEVREWDATRVTAWYTQSREEVDAARGKYKELAELLEKKQREVLDLHEKEQKAKKKAEELTQGNTRKAQILAQLMGGGKKKEEDEEL